jgi:hypothetical protein
MKVQPMVDSDADFGEAVRRAAKNGLKGLAGDI